MKAEEERKKKAEAEKKRKAEEERKKEQEMEAQAAALRRAEVERELASQVFNEAGGNAGTEAMDHDGARPKTIMDKVATVVQGRSHLKAAGTVIETSDFKQGWVRKDSAPSEPVPVLPSEQITSLLNSNMALIVANANRQVEERQRFLAGQGRQSDEYL